MNLIISFQSKGYEPFFDFIKAYAIVCVLVGHTFPNISQYGYFFWAGMQVPLFVLVQSFHVLKKPTPTINFKKLATRILIPFILVTSFYLAFRALKGGLSWDLLAQGMTDGGYGPGCYFPWIYIQMAVILYFARFLLDKGDIRIQCAIAILVCELFEIFSSYLGLSDKLYRLLAVRYFFLVFLAWSWVKYGIVINIWTVCLSLLSLASIVYFHYLSTNDEPFFFHTSWTCHRWPCYFYLSTLFCAFLYFIYKRTAHNMVVNRIVTLLSTCSYEIFLIQMIFILMCPQISFFPSNGMNLYFRIAVIWLVSILGGYIFHRIYSKTIGLLNIK